MTGRKQLAIGALVVGITAAVAYGATHYLRKELFPVQLGSKAPDFTAYTLDSVPKEKKLADYRGQVLLINVWATWCLPCTFEILHDPKGKITDDYDITGYPETFIIGKDGVIRKKLMSATDWNSPEARALVNRLLTERTE